jgi:hypothetical protein
MIQNTKKDSRVLGAQACSSRAYPNEQSLVMILNYSTKFIFNKDIPDGVISEMSMGML